MPADIAIIGAGPSGLALAAICERQGLDYVLYERGAKNVPPRGGCLDLHAGSGQRAMKEAGVFEEFRKRSRAGAATELKICDHHGNEAFRYGEGRDSPEIDREDIRQTLLSGIPKEKIRWNMGLESATRGANGNIRLGFVDGTEVDNHKLIVGADGVNSKVRHLVTRAEPRYSGLLILSSGIAKDNVFYPAMLERVGDGPMAVIGRSLHIWMQKQGTGDYRVELGVLRPKEFGTCETNKFQDLDAWKETMLSYEFFGMHGKFYRDAIAACDKTPHPWPLWEMPVDSLSWVASSNVTLIGDAVHATMPFLGDGANCAMRDAVILAHRVKELGFGKEAIEAYETEMFGHAKTMISGSNASGKLFLDWDGPQRFVDMMHTKPIIGLTDDY